MTLLVTFICVLILLAISAFFSLAETSLTSASKPKIHKLQLDGDKKAKIVMELISTKRERMMSAILFGNNFANTMAASVASAFLVTAFGSGEGVVYSAILMTIMIFLFAELLPKIYAYQEAERTALRVSGLVNFITNIFTPVTFIIEIVSQKLIKIFPSDTAKDDGKASAVSEIMGAIELHHASGGVVKNERNMLGSVLALSNRMISHVMVHRVNIFALEITKQKESLIKESLAAGYNRIPLWKENRDNIVAVLDVKKLLKKLEECNYNYSAAELPTLEPHFVPSTNTLYYQLGNMRENGVRTAFVIDEYGTLMGLITLQDIVEEVVGHLGDQPTLKQNIQKITETNYIISGSVSVSDINRELDWYLPEKEAATIGGLATHHFTKIPELNEEVIILNYKLTVIEKKDNYITKLNIERLD